MIVATFGPSTAWVGRTISFDDGRFSLDDVGQITPQAVVDYDGQGHLRWAYGGLREWVYQVAGVPLPVAVPEAPAGLAVPAPSAAPPPSPGAPPSSEVHATLAVPVAAATAQTPAQPQPLAPPQGAQPQAEGQPPLPPVGATATPPPEPPTPPPPPQGGRSRRVWFVLGGVIIVALLVGIVFAGGRLRDGLGIAFTLVAVAFVVALVVALVRPATAARWLPRSSPRTVQLACVGLAAVCLVLAGLLWWMPHYEVVAPADKRIALDDSPEIKVEVWNRGLLGGTYSATYSVDGKAQDDVQFPLAGGQGREMTLSLPNGVARGPVTLSLGGASVAAQAVAPPAFAVAPLRVDPSPAKQGDAVKLETSVKNTGDIAGTFGGKLLVNGRELLTQPVEIAPGQTRNVTYDLTADRAGAYELALGDATADFLIVKPVRLANGYVVKRSASGGRASLTITNKTGSDAVAVLTRSSNKRKPVVAVYIRKNKKATLGGIPDGTYILWDCCGEDFNWTMRDFFTPVEHKRWVDALKFDTTASTKHWTSYWSDAYYNYSQGHSQTTTHWTNWTVTLGTGESRYTKIVSTAAFPQL
jgi:hypothetical protein